MPWKGILVAVILVAGVGAAVYLSETHGKKSHRLQLPGVVETQEVRLGSKIGGRVADVMVREGDIVSAGQLLVRFEAPEMNAQLEQQEGRLAAAEADLEKAKNGPRAEEIRQARSDVDTADADLKLAEENFDRAQRLFPKNAMSRADYDSAQAALSRAKTRVAFNHAKLDLLLAGTRKEDIQLAEANVVEARGKLAEIKANLKEADVAAPDRAIVEVVAVRKGDLVPPNQPVIRILRADDLWVKVYVPETKLGDIQLGQKVVVTIDAYPDRKFHGEVFKISSESEFTPRNVQSLEERHFQVFGIKVRVDDTQGIFKSGMAATVTFDL